MRRRTVVVAALGAAAALGGAGAALWLESRREDEPDIWNVRLRRPGGGELALADFRGHPLLLNFWATWCLPCIGELPVLAEVERSGRARVIGLSIDEGGAAAVRPFVAEHRIPYRILLADEATATRWGGFSSSRTQRRPLCSAGRVSRSTSSPTPSRRTDTARRRFTAGWSRSSATG